MNGRVREHILKRRLTLQPSHCVPPQIVHNADGIVSGNCDISEATQVGRVAWLCAGHHWATEAAGSALPPAAFKPPRGWRVLFARIDAARTVSRISPIWIEFS